MCHGHTKYFGKKERLTEFFCYCSKLILLRCLINLFKRIAQNPSRNTPHRRLHVTPLTIFSFRVPLSLPSILSFNIIIVYHRRHQCVSPPSSSFCRESFDNFPRRTLVAVTLGCTSTETYSLS